MPVLSKFFASSLGFKLLTAECHEISHVWHPSCYLAIWDALGDGMVFCLKTYGTLYINCVFTNFLGAAILQIVPYSVAHFTVYKMRSSFPKRSLQKLNSLIKTKGNLRRMNWKKIVKDTLRSSIFLTINMVLFLSWLCHLRKILGFAIWPTVSFVNSFLGSLMAIFIEKKKRRPMLALYLLNLASESVFRQLVHRNYLQPIPHARCLLFSIGLAYLFYATKQHDNTNTDLANLLNLTHGHGPTKLSQSVIHLPEKFKQCLAWLRHQGGRHPLCTHHKNSCISNALEPAVRNFAFGVAFNSLIKIVSNLRSPSKMLKSLMRFKLLQLPAFLATMPFIYQSSQCLLNVVFNRKLVCTHAISGGLSGLAMLIWPSTNVAMYTLWKAIEMAYLRLAEKYSCIPNFNGGDALLYSLAAGYLIGVAVIEPHALRRSYYKFLCDVTGNRMVLFNRRLIDKFGFESNKMFENYYAKLHPLFTTINPDLYMPVKSALVL